MFKKLKSKIAEEVKSSPSRIQQFAQATQAALSSTSSTASDTLSGSENFFSIAEEDTPQNSPHHLNKSDGQLNEAGASNVATINTTHSVTTLNNGSIPAYRTRKLSNSSMASDVSFRLPTYDSPAVYHLQSDMESASEFESDAASHSSAMNAAHLDLISKDQLHQAYKKAMERYQKYRGQYMEVARRYRDLERDNNKARAVLVETQDKALRRISELREQCTLEQQAKAHLESALRLEMEEMQCTIKTLKTKFSLMGENPDELNNHKENNLIQLADNNGDSHVATTKFESNSLINLNIDDLENGNNTNDTDRVKELNHKLVESNNRILEMKAREEENTILLAENKMMIHSELENKEQEVRALEQRLATMEKDLKNGIGERGKLQQQLKQFTQDNSTLSDRIAEALENNKRLESKITALNKAQSVLENSKKEVEAKLIIVESEKETIQTKTNQEIQKFKVEYNSLLKKNEELEVMAHTKTMENQGKLEDELKHVKIAHAEMSKQSNELQTTNKSLENEINELKSAHATGKTQLDTYIADNKTLADRLKQLIDEKQQQSVQLEGLNSQNSLIQSEQVQLQEQVSQLQESLTKVTADQQNTEYEEIKNLQNKVIDLEEKLEFANAEISEKTNELNQQQNTESDDIRKLQNNIVNLEEKLKLANAEISEKINDLVQLEHKLKEKDDSATDVSQLKNKIDSLKNEKRDLEKTLEKEIRDKSELKTQVTNILQEIGRLEEQLTEVKHSYAEIEKEKRALEERTEQLQVTKVKSADKDHHNQHRSFTEIEQKLQQIQCDNALLAEKNCLLEETMDRLNVTLAENELGLTSACERANELDTTLSVLRLECDVAKEDNAKLQEKLKQCLDENSRLLNAKELLDHDNRSLLDQCEAKDKEKLCVLDTNKCLEADKAKVRQDQITLENEKVQLAQDCDRLQNELELLQAENTAIKQNQHELQNREVSLTEEIASLTNQIFLLETDLSNNRKSDKINQELRTEKNQLEKANQQYLTELTMASKDRNAVEKRLQAKLSELNNLNQQYLAHLKEATDEVQELKEKLKVSQQSLEKLKVLEEVKIENEYLNTSVKHLQADIEKGVVDKAKVEREFLELNEKFKSQQCELYVLKDEHEKRTESFKDKDNEIEQLKSVCQRSQSLNEELQNEMKQLKSQCDTLKLLSDELQSSQAISETQLQSLNNKITHSEQLSETYQNELRKQKQLNAELKETSKKQLADLEQSRSELAQAIQRLDEKQQLSEKLSKEVDSSRAIIGDLNKDIESQLESLSQLQGGKEENENLQSKINELLEQQVVLQQQNKGPKAEELDTLKRQNESLKLELAEQQRIANGKISNLNNEIDELNENARAYKEKSAEVEVMRQKYVDVQVELELLKKAESVKIVTNENADSDEELEAVKLARNELESKLKRIMHEVQDVSNRNLFLEQQCENYMIMEQSNERLKLQNEKLSRQLDDTLVSLQHNDGCSANTEFEYLKNIMFQYLTNNINSNSSTLVKVIAAVLKFSPQQTQVVLERESHRKSLMGQINNLL